MMKKSSPFSLNNNRPSTAKKQSPIQNKVVAGMKKLSIQTKDFNPSNDEQLQLAKLYETIDQLIMKQKQYQNKGKYVEAEGCKRKVQALKELVERKQIEQIKQRHKQELFEIQRAHAEEMNCFNIEWDKIITELHQQISKMEEDLIKKHDEQIMNVEQDISGEKPKNFKESPQLLNLRKIEQELAKQENYMEAHQVQKKAEKLEKQEIEKWKKNFQSKGKNYLTVLKTKQQAEMNALRQKIQLAFDQKDRQRRIEEQRLIQKYENVVKQLMYQQNQELLKCEKVSKLSQYQKKSKPGQFGSTSRISMS